MSEAKLERHLGLLGLTATGICSMLGASIYIVPFMIQRNVPGIGPYVIPSFIFAAVPAIFAAFAYSALSSAMPRAGGSYIYASRGLNPYLGFIASFSQWFGLSIVIGVIAYIIIPFFRDAFYVLKLTYIAESLEVGVIRLVLALLLLWTFVFINIRGLRSYQKTLIPLMVLMFILGAIVIVTGYLYNQEIYISHLSNSIKEQVEFGEIMPFNFMIFLSASAVLFASFIGFDSISQAGSEAKNPSRNLPLAIGITIVTVGTFYMLFTGAVYHTVPWEYIAKEATIRDVTAPGLLSIVLPQFISAIIILGAAIALINDLPAMLLSVSRLMFAWAEDRIFPESISKVHPQYHTPNRALLISGIIASIGILGSHFAGDFFLGIDIMVTSMLVNFLLMCLTLFFIQRQNPVIADKFTLAKLNSTRIIMGVTGSVFIAIFLIVHTLKDLSSDTQWYYKSTPIWLIVMLLGSIVFFLKLSSIKRKSGSIYDRLKKLP
jgi:APA family basic amino acid/polyamine antiporter